MTPPNDSTTPTHPRRPPASASTGAGRARRRQAAKASLLTAALSYAERGWRVFPLRPGTKKPAVPDHPAHLCDGTDPRCLNGHTGWEQRATTDPARITRAWSYRRYGIGIACGPSGLLVVDLDTPKATRHATGSEHLAHLERVHGRRLPATFTVSTPGGGQHRYYRTPRHGPALGNTASRVGPYIDTRATGGYVVAPPTRTTDGRYRCIDPRPPVELPVWFAELLTAPTPPPPAAGPTDRNPAGIHLSDALAAYVATAVARELDRLAAAPAGRRNNTLFTAAVALGQLVGAGALDHQEAHQRLLEGSWGHVNAGAYTHRQAAETIASGLHRGARQPRRLPAHLTTPETYR